MQISSTYLPYKPSNPRTIRGASKRGWHIVELKSPVVKEVNGKPTPISWIGVNIWTSRYAKGYWLSNFMLGKFAFENSVDASMFIMQWTLK